MTISSPFIPLTNDKSGYYINSTYILHKPLGSGASGTVYLATHLVSNKIVAVKVIGKPLRDPIHLAASKLSPMYAVPIPVASIQEKSVEKYLNDSFLASCPPLYNEVVLHSQVCDHPNVLSIIEVLDGCEYFFIVLEYCEQGDLFSALIDKNWYVGDEVIAKHLFLQLLDAVEYLHSRSIFHCDLKPENILVSNNKTSLKIADFGLASSLPLCNQFGRGSAYYMAPENIVENEIYRKPITDILDNKSKQIQLVTDSCCLQSVLTQKSSDNNRNNAILSNGYPRAASDVWSLGVILLNLLFGRSPWKKASFVEDIVYKGFSIDPRRLEYVLPVSKELNTIMADVFHPDPYRRIDITELRRRIVACNCFSKVNKVDFPWFAPRKSVVQLCRPKTRPENKYFGIQDITKTDAQLVYYPSLINTASSDVIVNFMSPDYKPSDTSLDLSTSKSPVMNIINAAPIINTQANYLCGVITPVLSTVAKPISVMTITSCSSSSMLLSLPGGSDIDSYNTTSSKRAKKQKTNKITNKKFALSAASATSTTTSSAKKKKPLFGRKLLDKISHHRTRILPRISIHDFSMTSKKC